METSRPKDHAEGFEELLAIFKAAGERIETEHPDWTHQLYGGRDQEAAYVAISVEGPGGVYYIAGVRTNATGVLEAELRTGALCREVSSLEGHLDELRPDAVARFLVKGLFDRLNESLKRPLH